MTPDSRSLHRLKTGSPATVREPSLAYFAIKHLRIQTQLHSGSRSPPHHDYTTLPGSIDLGIQPVHLNSTDEQSIIVRSILPTYFSTITGLGYILTFRATTAALQTHRSDIVIHQGVMVELLGTSQQYTCCCIKAQMKSTFMILSGETGSNFSMMRWALSAWLGCLVYNVTGRMVVRRAESIIGSRWKPGLAAQACLLSAGQITMERSSLI